MKTISLVRPIKRAGGDVAEIALRDLDGAGDLRGIKLQAVQEMDVNTILTLVARLSLTPLAPDEINAISPPDLLTLTAEIAGFFIASGGRSPTTP